uniref:Uncharacterized protein n=1 Tax=Siphoviridae sp. ctfdk3 TaxID=2826416 RepID=A0A8S5NIW9_9CAUD|nr:MAG TPA: hypothetical protein [Siphoviridae sp. ctfdk3]DAK72748.1 MAG TPA: hypothetical protein [Caudoviricetes sp.]DAZ05364.1 MAG TPA: hypothetical protein [Caudoviricetes sp.]DAZ37057.1 MAG TPA: hypothetical protein [Caudoviricetes sp.]
MFLSSFLRMCWDSSSSFSGVKEFLQSFERRKK